MLEMKDSVLMSDKGGLRRSTWAVRLTPPHPSPWSPGSPMHTHFIVFTVKRLQPYPLEPTNCSKNIMRKKKLIFTIKHKIYVTMQIPKIYIEM